MLRRRYRAKFNLGLWFRLDERTGSQQSPIQLTIWSTVFGTLLAFVFGLGKLLTNGPVRWLSASYIEVFRGTPLLVQLFWLYFPLPLAGEAMGINLCLHHLLRGPLALSLNTGDYGAEVVHGAVQVISPGQYEATKSLNFMPRAVLWQIALPQAVPEMIPPFGDLAIQGLKDTALVSLISLGDLAFWAEQLRNFT